MVNDFGNTCLHSMPRGRAAFGLFSINLVAITMQHLSIPFKHISIYRSIGRL